MIYEWKGFRLLSIHNYIQNTNGIYNDTVEQMNLSNSMKKIYIFRNIIRQMKLRKHFVTTYPQASTKAVYWIIVFLKGRQKSKILSISRAYRKYGTAV